MGRGSRLCYTVMREAFCSRIRWETEKDRLASSEDGELTRTQMRLSARLDNAVLSFHPSSRLTSASALQGQISEMLLLNLEFFRVIRSCDDDVEFGIVLTNASDVVK